MDYYSATSIERKQNTKKFSVNDLTTFIKNIYRGIFFQLMTLKPLISHTFVIWKTCLYQIAIWFIIRALAVLWIT